MAGAGDYRDRCAWLKRTTTGDPATGEVVESWVADGYLWCKVEITTGRRQEDYGADRPGSLATIRVRNRPALSALDRLHLVADGVTWVLESIRRGENELICSAHQFDGGPVT